MNRSDHTILVTGATGNQGGATARHLLASGWRVRALVRDTTAPAARALAAAGADLVRGDLLDPSSISAAMQGAYGVYSVQAAGPDEVAQGVNVAEAAKAEGVRHLVYSSVGGMREQNRYYLEQGWEPINKSLIERHIAELGVPATVLRPAAFMEDFTKPERFLQNGTVTVPWGDDLAMQLIAIDDTGAMAALVFTDPETYVGRSLEITGDRLTTPEIAAALSEAAGRPIPHKRVPHEVLWDHNPEVAKVYTWANATYYDADPAAVRALHPGLMDFRNWLERSGRDLLTARLNDSATTDTAS